MQEKTQELTKGSWQSPLPVPYNERYAPNEADCFYAADHRFRRWLRANVNHLMTGWDAALHGQPGFVKFCMWAQFQFLDHIKGLALTIKGNGFSKFIKEQFEDDTLRFQEYEDNDNSSIEWGDERAKASSPTKHIIFSMYSEFVRVDYPNTQWFMLMFSNREQHGDDTASYFAPERPSDAHGRTTCRDMRAVGRHMLREVQAAEKELHEFYAAYEKQFPMSDEPEEWRS